MELHSGTAMDMAMYEPAEEIASAALASRSIVTAVDLAWIVDTGASINALPGNMFANNKPLRRTTLTS